ncbi:MAG: ribonuclease III [Cetobacterium sp.]|nr:ribonuclease III [Cetobacterium sp.]
MKKSFLELEKKIGYTFNDKELLKTSLIHRSFGNEHWRYKKINNERLELLGDAVLDLVVTEYLYKNFDNSTEGDLAKMKSMIVSEPILAKISKELEFGKYLLLSKGEEITGGRERSSILGDVFEAILGAIYLDSNFEISKEVALKHIKHSIDHINENEDILDFKTILQEYSQKEYRVIPTYQVIKEIGPDHQKTFEIIVKIGDKCSETGIGKNKKSAEQSAAKALCKKLEVKLNETL